ncbi:MAG: DUF1501 domain-containing protein [Verrucomicrobiaceae bacterium]|nr:DUF1501 domain-containing protein [Verrucomicrobiaceae bacterium]
MFTVLGQRTRHRCDGGSRRSFLKAGSLGLAGLTLADVLRAEQVSGGGASHKAVINIHLDGGPPQMDLIDPKPEAPSEYRSPFSSIPTAIPGFNVTELLPKVASIANELVFLRSLVGAAAKHDAFQCQSGFNEKSLAAVGGRPALGCVVNHLLGSAQDRAPTFVDLMQGRPLARNSARPGFLGPAFGSFRPDISHLFERELEAGMKVEVARLGAGHTTKLSLMRELSVGRLDDRLSLLGGLDRTRRAIDHNGHMDALDTFTQQAYRILTSGEFAAAMDLEKEDPKMLDRYTAPVSSSNPGTKFYTSEGPQAGRKLLLARRLIEAGVRCVSVSISDFDTHSNNNSRMRQLGPIVDHALHALITDLRDRGMLDSVTVLAWGEFGRTPKINPEGGRDHWPRVAMGIMAGGGMPGGVVLGATDRYAGEATERPIHYQDVIATLYHQLGIDSATTLTDPTGRPQFLVAQGTPIAELV